MRANAPTLFANSRKTASGNVGTSIPATEYSAPESATTVPGSASISTLNRTRILLFSGSRASWRLSSGETSYSPMLEMSSKPTLSSARLQLSSKKEMDSSVEASSRSRTSTAGVNSFLHAKCTPSSAGYWLGLQMKIVDDMLELHRMFLAIIDDTVLNTCAYGKGVTADGSQGGVAVVPLKRGHSRLAYAHALSHNLLR